MESNLSSRAQKILEERNSGYRVLYDTILDISIKDSPKSIYKTICENFKNICNANMAFIIAFNTNDNTAYIKCYSSETKTIFLKDKDIVINVSDEIIDKYRNAIQGELFEDDILKQFEEYNGANIKLKQDCKSYNYMFFNGINSFEIGLVLFEYEKHIRMRDLVDTYVNMCNIILQRIMANYEVKISNERFSALLKNSPIGILLINRNKLIVEINDKALEIIGVTREECFNKYCYEYYYCHNENKSCLCDKLNNTQKYGEEERVIFRKNGTTIPVLVNICIVKIEQDNYYLETIVDLSERKKNEKERELLLKKLFNAQKQESVVTLSAGVAHEINTPLQVLGNNMDFIERATQKTLKLMNDYKLLIDEFITDENKDLFYNKARKLERKAKFSFIEDQLPQSIDECKNNLMGISDITTYMKDFTEAEDRVISDIDVNDFVEKMVSIYCYKCKKMINIKIDLLEKNLYIQAVSAELKEVLMIIIDNAEDAVMMNEEYNRLIEITVYEKESFAGISIRDNGMGMTKEVQERVYEPFFTTKEIGYGTGQGLTRAYNIVAEQNNGKIYFDSEESVGTTFYLEFTKK